MEGQSVREGIALTAFTPRGKALAKRLAAELGGTLRTDEALADWTQAAFADCEALIFVGAAGIAVRSIAPYIQSKATDPAVLCVDEAGCWVIPILSGHIGGANALALRVAVITGGKAVITTATDLNDLFAVDLWAKKQGMTVQQPERIKQVSAKLLRGENIVIDCPYPVTGSLPAHVRLGSSGDVLVSYRRTDSDALQLVPRLLTLGIGCKRGTSSEALNEAFKAFCVERGILPEAFTSAASIDIKRDEAGLLAFCKAHGWPLRFYSAEELRGAEGAFTASAFVESVTGVDNVCERAAALASGGKLVEKKYAGGGVTFAMAEHYVNYDWSWQDG